MHHPLNSVNVDPLEIGPQMDKNFLGKKCVYLQDVCVEGAGGGGEREEE